MHSRDVVLQVTLENTFEQGRVFVVIFRLCALNVILDHALDTLFSTRSMHKIATEFNREQFRQMFVLCDGENFIFAEVGHVDAILK